MRKVIGMTRAALVAALILVATTALGVDRVHVEIGASPTLGPKDAPVTMVEFIDYQ
jgi:protein-disulfide isomerase